MELSKEKFKMLALSVREIKVLQAVNEGLDTPVRISRETTISRPAIYKILDRLRKRALLRISIKKGKKRWISESPKTIEGNIDSFRKELVNHNEGVEKLQGPDSLKVIVYRGKLAVQKKIMDIVENHKKERLYAIQGDNVLAGWNKTMGIEKTNKMNRVIRKNTIITEAIIPFGWFERQVDILGRKWAEDFEGRAATAHEIEERYFQHAGQIWLFKKSLYLMAMQEETIIEVKNSEIQKLVLSMFCFIQDYSGKFDLNSKLRDLISEMD